MKFLTKKIVAGGLSFFIALSGMASSAVADVLDTQKEEERYSIEKILSDYQYFCFEDLDTTGHTVGAVVAGGTGWLQSLGDGATAPSYLGEIKHLVNYQLPDGHWLKKKNGYGNYSTQPFYYTRTKVSLNQYDTRFKQVEPYLDLKKIFDELEKQSQLVFDSSSIVLQKEDLVKRKIDGNLCNVLKIPFSQGVKHVAICAKAWEETDVVFLTGVTVEDFKKDQYVISIEGNHASVGADYSYVLPGDAYKAVMIETHKSDGTKFFSQDWKPMEQGYLMDKAHGLRCLRDDGTIEDGQLYIGGMKFIWNFPDATNVETSFLPGHVVAPSARVTVMAGKNNPFGGSHFEGGIIGKNIKVYNAEAHFYPYNKIMPIKEDPVTAEPTKEAPVTAEPTKEAPVTAEPTKEAPVTAEPTKEVPVTAEPTKEVPVTAEPTKEVPVTAEPTKEVPVTAEPTKEVPVTAEPTKEAPVTAEPTKEAPVTAEPTKEAPVTAEPTKEVPVTAEPTKEVPVTAEPTKEVPVTAEPTKEVPVTAEPTKEVPVTAEPTKEVPVTAEPTKEVPVTAEPTKEAPVTAEPTKEAPVTAEPTKEVPVTAEPTKGAPVTAEPSKETPVLPASTGPMPLQPVISTSVQPYLSPAPVSSPLSETTETGETPTSHQNAPASRTPTVHIVVSTESVVSLQPPADIPLIKTQTPKETALGKEEPHYNMPATQRDRKRYSPQTGEGSTLPFLYFLGAVSGSILTVLKRKKII